MVAANGSPSATVVKVRHGADVRKTVIRHNDDVTLNDLLLMVQRLFAIAPSAPIELKYKDSGESAHWKWKSFENR